MPDTAIPQLSRTEAIEQLIERRLEEWDHPDDTRDALRTGRYGYEELSNSVLAEIWEDLFGTPLAITGEDPARTIELSPRDYQDLVTEFSHLLETLNSILSLPNAGITDHRLLIQRREHGTAVLKTLKERM